MSCDEILTSLEDEGGTLILYIGMEEALATLSESDSIEIPTVEYVQLLLDSVSIVSRGIEEQPFFLSDSLVFLTGPGEIHYLAEKIIPAGNYQEIGLQLGPRDDVGGSGNPVIEVGGYFEGEPYLIRWETEVDTVLKFTPPIRIERNVEEATTLHLLFDRSLWFFHDEQNRILDPGDENNSEQIIVNILNSLHVEERNPEEKGTPAPGEETGKPGNSEPLLSVGPISGLESDSEFIFMVMLSEASEDTVYVDYTTMDVSSKAGMDYQSVSGTLIIDPGIAETGVKVSILNDEYPEPDENFSLVLSNALNAGLDNISRKAIATIIDDD